MFIKVPRPVFFYTVYLPQNFVGMIIHFSEELQYCEYINIFHFKIRVDNYRAKIKKKW